VTETARVVILCGFMGTGKTATGHALASLLSVPFFDTDRLIEEASGRSVPAIFAADGEERFRDLEAEVVRSLQSGTRLKQGAVIATGGGILQRDTTHLALASLGKMIVLDAALESIAERAESLRDRPLLPRTPAGEIDRAAMRALFEKRAGAYARIEWHVDTTGRTPPDVAFEIAERLRHAGGMIHLRVGARPLLSAPVRRGETGLSRVVVQRGALASLGTWVREIGIAGPVFVFSSRTVAGFHGVSTRKSLDAAGIKSRFIEIDDSENAKNMDQAERLLYELADAGATRDTAVIALGGGVTGDLAGFVAATYMRGVAFVQVPTTLVAQADASIGGKVGVNHPRAKNLIGTIHQPHLVLSDPDTLATLPARELASGMAEVVKTAIIGSPNLFESLRAAAVKGAPQGDPVLLEAAVRECVRIKGHIVEADPFERDERRMLNLGHTLGHAIESVSGYGSIAHGEAVAIGLMAALEIAVKRGAATRDFVEATRSILIASGLPVRMPPLDEAALRAAFQGDKKRRAGGLAFVLPVAPGDVRIVGDVAEDELIRAAAA
jgi:shikimate kinase/3-dehydroquinate synthase